MVVWTLQGEGTANPMLGINKYPLLKPQDFFATLAGRKHSTKIDLTNAYQ